MLTTRQYLKCLDPVQLRKLFSLCDFTETELKLMIFAYVERRYVANICDRLHICKKQYHNIQNIALAKVECKLKEIDILRH